MAETDPILESLVFEFLERRESEGDNVLDELCRRHPGLASGLQRRANALRTSGMLGAGDAHPERLGEFRLLERLGAGGMGVVYLAEQETLGRRVALKLIRPEHMFFPGARERFRREVTAVARLAHPGIVPVHTFGEDNGIPYYAMELVAGVSLADVLRAIEPRDPARLGGADLRDTIRRLCQERNLAPVSEADETLFAGSWTEACLWMVRDVAEALEHAHQRGVFHRDIKPSNVMVTPSGRVLLLDFGLASTKGADRITRSGSQVGSVPYMAPEIVRGSASDSGVQSDVYSLGVLLYEMLTLHLPFEEHDSTRLMQKIVAGGAPSPRSLNPTLARDLEDVCRVAIEVDPARRFASAAHFARDLTNVLQRRPIEARPPSSWVQMLRWAQREPAAATAAGLALLIAIGGPIGYALQESHARARIEAKNVALKDALEEATSQKNRADENANRAKDQESAALREAENARRETQTYAHMMEFLVGMFGRGDPDEARGRTVTVKEVLDRGAANIETRLAAEPVLRARLESAMGDLYAALGQIAQAEPLERLALERYEVDYGALDPKTMHAWIALCSVLKDQGDYAQTVCLLQELESKLDPADPALSEPRRRALTLHGETLLLWQGPTEESDLLLQEAVAGDLPVVPRDEAWWSSWAAMGASLLARGRYEEARGVFESQLAAAVAAYGWQHSRTLTSVINLAETYNQMDHRSEAIKLIEAVRGDVEQFFGPEHPNTMATLNNLASALNRVGRGAEAAPIYERVIATRKRILGEDHLDTLVTVHNYARALEGSGRVDDAIALYTDILPRVERVLGPEHFLSASIHNSLAWCYKRQGKLDLAKREILASLATTPADHPLHKDRLITLQKIEDLIAAQQNEPSGDEKH